MLVFLFECVMWRVESGIIIINLNNSNVNTLFAHCPNFGTLIINKKYYLKSAY